MRQFYHSIWTKRICYPLILALLTSLVPPLQTPAVAQLVPTYSVGVVDFVNESGVQGDVLARLATDAVVVEMSKSNRYAIENSRSQITDAMKKLDLRPPLSKVGLIRLGEELGVDAMLQGSIKAVRMSGSGASRRATVVLSVQLVDQTSGEIINGSVQEGTSSARVGYTADDEALISESISNASYLCVKQMIDYVIPEATVQMNIGDQQVMINRGGRNGVTAGMQMIVLREKEIIGYITVQRVDPTDSIAKVTKSFQGIKPEDKVRAIYDMPTISYDVAKEAPLPSGAPKTAGSKGSDTLKKIGQFLVAALVVFGLVSMFKGDRSNENGPDFGAGDVATVLWSIPPQIQHSDVLEVQIMRDNSTVPFIALSDPTAIDQGWYNFYDLYAAGTAIAVSYIKLPSNPWTSTTAPVPVAGSFPAEGFGTQHSYRARIVYKHSFTVTDLEGTATTTTRYYYTDVSPAECKSTVIEQTVDADEVTPTTDDEFTIAELSDGTVNFEWAGKTGANEYKIEVEAINPSLAFRWTSNSIYTTSSSVELSASDRISLANLMTSRGIPTDTAMRWRILMRNTTDTSQNYYKTNWVSFKII